MNAKEFIQKNKLKVGASIKFDFNGEEIKGTILPSNEDNLLVKLSSGYNAGFNPEQISSLKNLGENKNIGKPKTIKVSKNPQLPTISILHTGGTIASRVNYSTGGVFASFDVEDLVTMFPELLTIANLESVFVANMMSEDMTLKDYQKIARTIAEEIKKGVKGIIVGHGTDTLAYDAAMLSFMLENCPIPVIIVGSQRSTDRGSSDGAMNLICASTFITKTNFKGVAICMHNSMNDDNCAILPATKTRKMHTSRRDAFKAINDKQIALIDYKTKDIIWTKNKKEFETTKGNFELKDKVEEKVGLIKTYPGISEKQIEFFITEKYKGLIIEGTGLGHTPVGENEKFIKTIKKLVGGGCIVAMTSQCINGRVHTSVYSTLRKLEEAGVIYCEDMLAETAYVKLAWLLANKPTEVKALLSKNLRGEISNFTQTDTYEY